MPYNEITAERIRSVLRPYKKDVEEKKMMGGLTFMLNGKMCCGVHKDTLMVRVVSEKRDGALAKPFCRVMDFTGKPMKNFLSIDMEGYSTEKDLKSWIALGIEFVLQQAPDKKTKKHR